MVTHFTNEGGHRLAAADVRQVPRQLVWGMGCAKTQQCTCKPTSCDKDALPTIMKRSRPPSMLVMRRKTR